MSPSSIASGLLLAFLVGPADVTLQLLDGSSLPVGAIALGGDRTLLVQVGGESRTVAVDDVLFATVAAAAELPALETNTSVLLVDGSRLTGALGEEGLDLIRLRTAALGTVEVPIDRVRAITFGPEGDRLLPSGLAGRATDDDLVYRRGPVEGDVVTGTVVRLGPDGVDVDSDLGKLSLSLDEVLGIGVAAFGGEAEPRERPVDVELQDGGLLVADLLELSSGRLKVRSGWDATLTVDLARVAALRFGSARFEWLSDEEPAEVVETPFLGGSDDFLFPWRRDRTVTGGPLVVGGVRYGKGLGLHSRTRLTWNLDGRFARLDAVAGVADEVLRHGATGSMIVRVRVDGEVRFESEALEAGRPAVPIRVDLTGAKALEVEADFGDRGDVLDRLVIGDAVLVLAGD